MLHGSQQWLPFHRNGSKPAGLESVEEQLHRHDCWRVFSTDQCRRNHGRQVWLRYGHPGALQQWRKWFFCIRPKRCPSGGRWRCGLHAEYRNGSLHHHAAQVERQSRPAFRSHAQSGTGIGQPNRLGQKSRSVPEQMSNPCRILLVPFRNYLLLLQSLPSFP